MVGDEPKFPKPGAALVLIDTNIVKNVLVGHPRTLQAWEQLPDYRDRFTFAVAASTFAELLIDIVSGEVPWERWLEGRQRLRGIVEGEFVGRESMDLAHYAQTKAEERERERALWRSLLEAETMSDLIDPPLADPLALTREITRDESARFSALIKRQEDHLRSVLGDRPLPSLKDLIENALMRERPENRQAVDVLIRVAVARVRERFAKKNPYNPDRRGASDLNDIRFLSALTLPAYGLTDDGPLRRIAVQTEWPFAFRLFSLEAFVEAVRNGTLPPLEM